MTKDAAVAALLLALALLPSAAAHGAPPVRDIDARVLLDDDGLVGYGGCLEGECVPGSEAGLDVLALDVREAYLPDGSPAVVFRLIVQSEAPVAGAALALHVGSPGGGKDFRADTADGLAFTSASFDRLDGPFDVGDGHPKALDGWVRLAALGKPGDALSGITVQSLRGDAGDDAMPGGWSSNGVEVPAVTQEEAAEGTYTLSGPALLVSASANGTADLAHGPAKVGVVLVNPTTVQQFANVSLGLPDGATATLASTQVILQPSATRTVELTVSNATVDGVVNVVVSTDLGGRAVAGVPVRAPPPVASNSTAPSTTASGSKDSPALGAAALLLPLAAAVLLRRRR